MRVVIDTDLGPNLIRLTIYGHSNTSLAWVLSELQRVLMHGAAKVHYERSDLDLVGFENQQGPMMRWGWLASATSPTRTLMRRDEIAEIELRTQVPPEELPLPSKCIECILEDDDESEDAPGLPAHSGDPRLKIPDGEVSRANSLQRR